MKRIHERAIDMTDLDSVTYWAAELGVDETQFRSAVGDVGVMPGALEFYLADGPPGASTSMAERASFQTRKAERFRASRAAEDEANASLSRTAASGAVFPIGKDRSARMDMGTIVDLAIKLNCAPIDRAVALAYRTADECARIAEQCEGSAAAATAIRAAFLLDDKGMVKPDQPSQTS